MRQDPGEEVVAGLRHAEPAAGIGERVGAVPP